MKKLLLYLTLSVLWISGLEARSKYVKEEEDNPYEFGFTIDGQQHRHEKKDANGIIQGEFGFITADGVYHVTVYATDENGNFKILSMRNVKISEPLDQPNAQLPDTSQFSKEEPHSSARPNALSINTTPAPAQTIKPVTEVNRFTTQATIKPACAGCGYVTHKTPLNNNLPFQTSAINNPKPGSVVIGDQPPQSEPQNNIQPGGNVPFVSNPSRINPQDKTQLQFEPDYDAQPPTNNANSQLQPSVHPKVTPTGNTGVIAPFVSNTHSNNDKTRNPLLIQQNDRVNTDISSGSGISRPGISDSSKEIQENLFKPNINLPSVSMPGDQSNDNSPNNYPGEQEQYPQNQNYPDANQGVQPDYPQISGPPDNNAYVQKPPEEPLLNPLSIGAPNNNANQPSSVGPSGITVSNGMINIPNNPPIQIQDKYPGMVDGLPDGISQGDITDLLYKFNYTVGFHGHYEKGYKNGAKVGGYFVTDRDGVSRIVTYVADENGYRPKVKFIRLDLNSDLVPKEGTEKTFGLKNFEFVWYPIS